MCPREGYGVVNVGEEAAADVVHAAIGGELQIAKRVKLYKDLSEDY